VKAQALMLNFFPAGDDLPIFSGAPVAVTVRPFVPTRVARQESLLDLRLDPFHTLAAPASKAQPNQQSSMQTKSETEEEAPWSPTNA
jgi:hypothetical protein